MGQHTTPVRRWRTRMRVLGAVAALSVLLSACFTPPGGEAELRVDAPPNLSVTNVVATSPAPFEISIVFAEPDISRLGLPAEAPIPVNRTTSLGGETRRADIPAEAFFIEFVEDQVDLGCFESPVLIRNDTTNEAVMSITDWCPGLTGAAGFNLSLFGVYGLQDETGWSYFGPSPDCCRVVIAQNETDTAN